MMMRARMMATCNVITLIFRLLRAPRVREEFPDSFHLGVVAPPSQKAGRRRGGGVSKSGCSVQMGKKDFFLSSQSEKKKGPIEVNEIYRQARITASPASAEERSVAFHRPIRSSHAQLKLHSSCKLLEK